MKINYSPSIIDTSANTVNWICEFMLKDIPLNVIRKTELGFEPSRQLIESLEHRQRLNAHIKEQLQVEHKKFVAVQKLINRKNQRNKYGSSDN